MILKLVCKQSYDPYYGYSIIRQSSEVYVNELVLNDAHDYDSIMLTTRDGQYLGTIYKAQLFNYFRTNFSQVGA
jgi:hypothetical protein